MFRIHPQEVLKRIKKFSTRRTRNTHTTGPNFTLLNTADATKHLK